MSTRPSPYRAPFERWNDEVTEAHRAMPKTVDGFIVNPRFIPKPSVQRELTTRWREWSRRFPPRVWPLWLEAWLAQHPAAESAP